MKAEELLERHAAGERDFREADLSEADLSEADLRGANLRGADLRDANLRDAYLYNAYLYNANLYGANLERADLCDANLRGANLRHVCLRDADLSWTKWHGMTATTPSGPATLTPTPNGWHLSIGCWDGTIQDLRDLITGDAPWPAAAGTERARRRPILTALADMCDAHTAYYSGVIEALAALWGKQAQS